MTEQLQIIGPVLQNSCVKYYVVVLKMYKVVNTMNDKKALPVDRKVIKVSFGEKN